MDCTLPHVSTHRREYQAEPYAEASAPGVVTLMGAHTEVHEGSVLMLGMPQRANVCASLREDHTIRCYSLEYDERRRWGLNSARVRVEDRWANQLKGIVRRLQTLGARVPGVDVTISSTIPAAVGVGASQAIGVAFSRAVAQAAGFPLDAEEAAQVAYYAESRFLEREVGFASFLAAALAKPGFALLVDCRTLESRHLRFAIPRHALYVVDPRIEGCANCDDFAEREEGVRYCLRRLAGASGLKRATGAVVAELEASLGTLPERARRYCLHVIMEEQRVHELGRLLLVNDAAAIGKTLLDSHESLRDLYEVSCPEVDWIVRHTRDLDGVCGTRLCSNRGGASVITLMRESAATRYREELAGYERIFGYQPRLFTSTASGGVAVDAEQEVI